MKRAPEDSFEGSISEQLFLRRSGRAFCPVCEKQVELLTFDHAAELFRTDLQDIEFLTKNGSVHQVHNRRGKVMACSESLFECFEKRKTRLLDSGFLQKAAKKSA